MISPFDAFWPWMVYTLGQPGAVLCTILVLASCLGGLISPLYILLLYRRSCVLEKALVDLKDRAAFLSRQQTVDRLRRDKNRDKSGRRR